MTNPKPYIDELVSIITQIYQSEDNLVLNWSGCEFGYAFDDGRDWFLVVKPSPGVTLTEAEQNLLVCCLSLAWYQIDGYLQNAHIERRGSDYWVGGLNTNVECHTCGQSTFASGSRVGQAFTGRLFCSEQCASAHLAAKGF